jgi:glucans biosynthesis protein
MDTIAFSSWRRLLLGVVLFALGTAAAVADDFDFAHVEKKAQELANAPYDGTPAPVPAFLTQLTPEQYAQIQDVNPLWSDSDSPFQVQFYLPGSYFPRPEKISVVENGQSRPIPFRLANFTFGDLHPDSLPQDLGYAGFRLLYPLNTPPNYNEFISFLGATYFRAVGKDAIYGTSARGIGIDTAQSSGEIFPYYSHIWLVKPAPGSSEMTVYALMDSSVVTGAYRFVIHPGTDCVVDVESTIYLRKPVQVLELAPLTSMFWHGHGRGVRAGDWHPAQHDSSELVLADGNGEWISRPLDNPLQIQTTTYSMQQPQGFGLIQQPRDFSAYQGIDTQYQRRPSVWVSPVGDWGEGQVHLVELPTNNPDMDNIDVFWVPATQPQPGQPYHYAYQLRFFNSQHGLIPLAHPIATYLGYDTKDPEWQRVVVDFADGALAKLPQSMAVRAHFSAADGAQVRDQQVQFSPDGHFWRLSAEVQTAANTPSNLRAYLTLDGQVMTDTWTFLLQPAKGGR